MRCQLIRDSVVSDVNPRALRLHNKSHYGILDGNTFKLSLIEATYLLENKRINVYRGNEKISLEEMKNILRRHNLYQKYLVFRDLRNRGYIVKTGLKYGSEFRLYERGKAPGKGHSKYLVRVVTEDDIFNVKDIVSQVRVAHSVRKKINYGSSR